MPRCRVRCLTAFGRCLGWKFRDRWWNSGYRRRVHKVNRGKFTENIKKNTGFWLKTGEACGRTWPIKKTSNNSAERNSPFWCNCATTLWIWNGMTVPVMSCRTIEFASMIGKWLKERSSSHRNMYIVYSQVKRALWNVGWCAIGDDICNCVVTSCSVPPIVFII